MQIVRSPRVPPIVDRDIVGHAVPLHGLAERGQARADSGGQTHVALGDLTIVQVMLTIRPKLRWRMAGT